MFVRTTVIAIIIFSLESCNNQDSNRYQKKKASFFVDQSEALFEANEIDSAGYLIEKALQLDPENYRAYNNRAFINFKRDSPAEVVIADYKKALKIKPDYETALFSLANYYFDTREYENAVNACTNFEKHAAGQNSQNDQIVQIRRLKEKAIKLTEVVNGIPLYKAEEFYDSLTLIVNQTNRDPQKLIDLLTRVENDYTNYKGAETYRLLGTMFNKAVNASLEEKTRLKNIKEIDTTIHFKKAIEKYNELFDLWCNEQLKPYLFGKEYLGILGIRRMLINSSPSLHKIKGAEIKWYKAQKEFKIKYKIDSLPDL
jgi:tetratricopeptide (TPR) repeat protein